MSEQNNLTAKFNDASKVIAAINEGLDNLHLGIKHDVRDRSDKGAVYVATNVKAQTGVTYYIPPLFQKPPLKDTHLGILAVGGQVHAEGSNFRVGRGFRVQEVKDVNALNPDGTVNKEAIKEVVDFVAKCAKIRGLRAQPTP